ncbi:MAG: hypothetical protein ACRELF_29700, partial [Gemmataceae bacterium]
LQVAIDGEPRMLDGDANGVFAIPATRLRIGKNTLSVRLANGTDQVVWQRRIAPRRDKVQVRRQGHQDTATIEGFNPLRLPQSTVAIQHREGGRRYLATVDANGHYRVAVQLSVGENQFAIPQMTGDPIVVTVAGPTEEAERWNSGDLSVLAGCWDRSTSLSTTDYGHPENKRPVKWWGMCFNKDGTGQEKLIYVSGGKCQSALTVQFEKTAKGGMRLRFADTGNMECGDHGQYVFKAEAVCTRIGEGRLNCVGEQPKIHNKVAWELRRQGGAGSGSTR